MKFFTVQEASKKLLELVEDVLINHKLAVIFGKHKNVALVAESDWTAKSEEKAIRRLQVVSQANSLKAPIMRRYGR